MNGGQPRIVARQPWRGSGVLAAHVDRSLRPPLQQPGLADLAAVAARQPMAAAFLEALQAALDPEFALRFASCTDPRALVVVTGQQPGCAGGPLLVLLKAATAVALARRAGRDLQRPVVPVFWNAADDVDFDEIARVTWPGTRGELLFLELTQEGRRSQSLVGDLPAAADDAAARAALGLLGTAARQNLMSVLPATARDHGDWVARLLARVFPTLAVVDSRLPVLRRFAAPLFARYLESTEAAAALVEADRAALAAAGFTPLLAAESLRQGLFLLVDGQRHKTNADMAPLRRALASSPESLTPNVMLRPLVQDALFPVLASVVGPAEIAYLHELRGLRAQLDVPEVALVPRLGLTLLAPGEWEAAGRQGLDAAALLADDDGGWRRAARRRAGARLETAQAAFASLQAELSTLVTSGLGQKSVSRVARRLQKLGDELDRSLEDEALRELWETEPALEGLQTRLRPRGRPQERNLAALWLLAAWGEETGERLIHTADAHLEALQRGTLEHLLVLT